MIGSSSRRTLSSSPSTWCTSSKGTKDAFAKEGALPVLLRGRTKSVSIHVRPSLSRVWVGGRVVCARARASHVSGIECGMDLTPFVFMNVASVPTCRVDSHSDRRILLLAGPRFMSTKCKRVGDHDIDERRRRPSRPLIISVNETASPNASRAGGAAAARRAAPSPVHCGGRRARGAMRARLSHCAPAAPTACRRRLH